MNNVLFSEQDAQDKRLPLLILLFHLGVVGLSKRSYSYASMMTGRNAFFPPPCSIQLAQVGMSLDYLVFTPISRCKDGYSLY